MTSHLLRYPSTSIFLVASLRGGIRGRNLDMQVTLYTDASFRPPYGAWGICANSNAGQFVESRPCPPFVQNSFHAEMCAIYCGVRLVITRWPETTGVVVRTDCQGVVRDLKMPFSDLVVEAFREGMVAVIGNRKLKMTWVRGHQGARAREHSVGARLNAQVDRLAGQITNETVDVPPAEVFGVDPSHEIDKMVWTGFETYCGWELVK